MSVTKWQSQALHPGVSFPLSTLSPLSTLRGAADEQARGWPHRNELTVMDAEIGCLLSLPSSTQHGDFKPHPCSRVVKLVHLHCYK